MRDTSYHNDHSFYRIHHRRYVWRRRLALLAVLVLAGAVGYVAYDLYKIEPESAVKPTSPTRTTIIAGPREFTSTYFKFSDTGDWKYDAAKSTPTQATYVLSQGNLPVHRFTVYVNETPGRNDLAVTRVLPVEIREGKRLLTAGPTSDSCGKLSQPSDTIQVKQVSMSGTSFLCVPDSPQYVSVLGQVGGDYNIKLRRPDGTMANYIIIYRNLAYEHDPGPFERIVNTFQAN